MGSEVVNIRNGLRTLEDGDIRRENEKGSFS